MTRSSAIYRDNCGEVTARLRDESAWEASPARRQAFQPAQHEGRPPVRMLGVVKPQVGQTAQQGRDRDLRLDAGQLGAEAKMNAPAERQRTHIGTSNIETIRP